MGTDKERPILILIDYLLSPLNLGLAAKESMNLIHHTSYVTNETSIGTIFSFGRDILEILVLSGTLLEYVVN